MSHILAVLAGGGPKDGERIALRDHAPAWLRYPLTPGITGWQQPLSPAETPPMQTHCYERTGLEWHPSGSAALATYRYIGERS